MILNFLQRRDPPILPSLQKMQGRRLGHENGEESQFADDLDALRGFGDDNKETTADLLFHFFRHYGYEFQYAKDVVSVREGKAVSRQEKGWDPSNYQDKEARNRLCVEEPFTVVRNLGNSADDYAWSGIHGEIRRAFDLLADGCQLHKACEEYEFPPEEKPIFQRPVPKPKPTLTRSASQSGRPHHELGSGRPRRGSNRNQSAQRAGNRRASSGASFNNHRGPAGFHQSPSLAPTMLDYFVAKGDLHHQLYQQYQFLQAQQDLLRAQLSEQRSAAQAHHRPADLSSSPHQRPYPSGLSSPGPRYVEHASQAAPLLPGYSALYHYPARFHPSPSNMSPARQRDGGGASTGPSSPSLASAAPTLRRQAHRASAPDGSSTATRSQSQPGRSLPHFLAMQQQAHPGYDVTGAIGGQSQTLRQSSQTYPHALAGMTLPQMSYAPHPMTGAQPHPVQTETAVPKEYMGYFVNTAPSLTSPHAPPNQLAPAPMIVPDLTSQRQRRVTPELMPPASNGRHSSRSPSPLRDQRGHFTAGDVPFRSAAVGQSPSDFSQASVSRTGSLQEPSPILAPTPVEPREPLIVNGSMPAVAPRSISDLEKSPVEVPGHLTSGGVEPSGRNAENIRLHGGPPPSHPINPVVLQPEAMDTLPPSPATSQMLLYALGSRTNGLPQTTNGNLEHHVSASASNAPLLSPVAELRTPSPTHPVRFDKDVQTNGAHWPAKITSVTQIAQNENGQAKHERKGSAPSPTAKPSAGDHPVLPSLTASSSGNPWQQAVGKRSHKKSKSNVGRKSPNALGGQPLPANESERKGG